MGGKFLQTQSLSSSLRTVVAVTSSCFLIGLAGTYLFSMEFLSGLSELHKANQLYDIARQINQVVTTYSDMIRRPMGGGKAQALILYRTAVEQETQLFNKAERIASDLNGPNPLADARKAVERYKGLAEKVFNRGSSAEDLLVVNQLEIEAVDLLTKTQIELKAQSDRVFERIYERRFHPLIASLVLAGLFVCFSLVMGLRITLRIDRSIKNLLVATTKVAEGDLAYQAPIIRPDELGLVTHAFNEMTSELRENTVSRDHIESIMESLADVMVVTDKAGTILITNRMAETLFGYTRAELKEKSIHWLFGEELDLKPGVRDLETVGLTKSKEQVPISVSVTAVWNPAGQVTDLVCLIRDITERKKIENELRERGNALVSANKELEAFSYSVSHDLRAPLRGIDGFSQALLEDLGPKLDGPSKDYLERIRAGVQRMGKLIDDMLSLSRLSRKELLVRPVDMSAMVKEICDGLRAEARSRQVEVQVASGVKVQADPDLLQILLENLLGNAFKYTSKLDRPRIEFGVTTQEGHDTYFVRDNGAGFDMAYADKLFGAFQRLHRADEFPGTGVGLATVARVVHRHGGRVWAESQVGQGATFFFTLS